MTTDEYLEDIVKGLAGLPNNAVRLAWLNARIEACNLAHEAAQLRMAQGGDGPKVDFLTIETRIAALCQLRAKYQEAA